MRRSNCSALLLLAALPAGAQVIASVQSWSGVQIYFDAKIEPPPSPATNPAVLRQLEDDTTGGVIVDERAHRVWRDAAQKVYIGYDVSIEPGPAPKVFQVRIAPLSLTPQKMATYGFPETWTRLTLPAYPVIPQVKVDDTLAIDLMVNPKTGQKLVDYLTLQRTGTPLLGEPRDFTLDDAALRFDEPRVSVNGKLADATAHVTGGISGSPIWFYLRGEGRFVLSLVAKPGLHGEGEVAGNALTFRDGPDSYRVECSSQIGPSPGRYRVYVWRDRNWRPAGGDSGEPFLFGSSPLANLLHGHD